MQIEIAEPGRMTQSGSSLLKLIQNNNMPILDLLVRESIQNSLDAGKDNVEYVSVDFLTGTFDKFELNSKLEGVTDSLNRKFQDSECNKYIAIRDSNTVGLTGKLHYDDVTDNEYGNLLKLIYEISKPQENEGAGGSWGLGKTVYFRIGIGLVLYYSRIIDESGKYVSRLAASLVENELEQEALIPVINGKSKRGIAWWGEKIGDNKTRPVTDETVIDKILKIFNIPMYIDNETGTTIIIPYINEAKLLENNQIEYNIDNEHFFEPYWRNSVEEYLKIAVQRWYSPRLSNENYKYGKYLVAKINNERINFANLEPSFKIVQLLYNYAIGKKADCDILAQAAVDVKIEDITLNTILSDNRKAGTLAYAKIPKVLLKMVAPDNKPEPYMYFNCEIREKEKNKPIVFYTRKPGMIVSYDNVGPWVDGISSCNKDDFIMAIFVLNSDNSLGWENNKKLKLEEYIRKSEMADHNAWTDFSIGKFNPRIVYKVQSQIIRKISNSFAEEEVNENRLNSGLGKLFGDMLLPPENFGKKPSYIINPSDNTTIKLEKHKNVSFGFDREHIKYSADSMEVKLIIKALKEIDSTGIKLLIESESGSISVNEWENKLAFSMPFEISKSDIKVYKLDKKKSNIEMVIDYDNPIAQENCFKCGLIKSSNGTGCGIHVQLNEPHTFQIEFNVKLTVFRRDIKPVFIVEKEGEL